MNDLVIGVAPVFVDGDVSYLDVTKKRPDGSVYIVRTKVSDDADPRIVEVCQ